MTGIRVREGPRCQGVPRTATLIFILLMATFAQSSQRLSEGMVKSCPGLASFALPAGTKLDQRDELVSQYIASTEKLESPSCVSELVQTGLIQSASELLQRLVTLESFDQKARSELSVAIQKRQTQLEALIKLSLLTGTKLEARPALKWGQNFEEITLFLKYASRIDSPGCNDITEPQEQIRTEDDGNMSLGVTGICVLAGRPVKFVLDLPLYEKVHPGSLKVVSAGVGASIITFKKKQVSIWPQIWKKGFNKKGSPITVWWELAGAQFEKGMKPFRRLQQELDNEDSEGLWKDNPRQPRLEDYESWYSRTLKTIKSFWSNLSKSWL